MHKLCFLGNPWLKFPKKKVASIFPMLNILNKKANKAYLPLQGWVLLLRNPNRRRSNKICRPKIMQFKFIHRKGFIDVKIPDKDCISCNSRNVHGRNINLNPLSPFEMDFSISASGTLDSKLWCNHKPLYHKANVKSDFYHKFKTGAITLLEHVNTWVYIGIEYMGRHKTGIFWLNWNKQQRQWKLWA